MVNDNKKQLQFYLSMLKIGLIGFGGGSALIPLLNQEVVGKYVIESEFNEFVTAASVTPGALPVEIAAGIGYKLAARKGMLLGALAMALPGTTLTLFFLTSGILEMPWIKNISVPISLWVIWILICYVVATPRKPLVLLVFVATCGKNLWKLLSLPGKPLYLTTFKVFAIAFIIQFLFNDIKISLSWGLAKDILFLFMPTLLFIVLIPKAFLYGSYGCLSTLLSFGGGDAYLTIADAIFIDTGMLDRNVFYTTIVPLVNMLPGSILCKTLPAIGYILGGLSWGILGLFCSISVSCSVFRIAQTINIKKQEWIRPVVAGLMCTISLSILDQIIHTFIS